MAPQSGTKQKFLNPDITLNSNCEAQRASNFFNIEDGVRSQN